MSVVAGLEMLTYMTNKTMHFVDMKPVFMQMIADNKVDADNIVGMTLLVMILLVLVNIFNNVTTNTPKAECLTALEAWMIASILFVFGALAE